MVAVEPSVSSPPDHILITELENRTFSAWSPLDQSELSGWRLGWARGYTRRANSVYPLSWSHNDDQLEAQIDACERWYSERGLPICFKLTTASQPLSIDHILANRGYTSASGARVMTADLSRWQRGDTAAAPTVRIETQFTVQWLDALCAMNTAQSPHREVILQMLSGGEAERFFATVFDGERPVAVGLAVRNGNYVGLFDIVTHEAARRRGYGRRLVQCMLDVGSAAGARTAYLQVVERNLPAISLYESLGFHHVYDYWYRHKP
jgi:N-acetylglutamate synthase